MSASEFYGRMFWSSSVCRTSTAAAKTLWETQHTLSQSNTLCIYVLSLCNTKITLDSCTTLLLMHWSLYLNHVLLQAATMNQYHLAQAIYCPVCDLKNSLTVDTNIYFIDYFVVNTPRKAENTTSAHLLAGWHLWQILSDPTHLCTRNWGDKKAVPEVSRRPSHPQRHGSHLWQDYVVPTAIPQNWGTNGGFPGICPWVAQSMFYVT